MFIEALAAFFVVLLVSILVVVVAVDWLHQRKYTLYKVTEDKGSGIPFFVKERVYYHETVYRQSLADLSLVITRIEADATSMVDHAATLRVKWSDPVYKVLRTIWLLGDPVDHEQKEEAKAKFHNLADHIYKGELPGKREYHLASNRVRNVVVVNYDKRLYINTEQSLLGSSKMTVKLAPDGTFSEGEGSVDLAPLSELLALPGNIFEGAGGKLVEGVTKKPTVSPPLTGATQETLQHTVPLRLTEATPKTYEIELTVRPLFLLHVLSKRVKEKEDFAPLMMAEVKVGKLCYHSVIIPEGEPERPPLTCQSPPQKESNKRDEA